MKKTELKDLYSVMFPNYPDVVNAEQLSEMLGGVSTKTVYRLLKKGEIKSKYIGKRYVIPNAMATDSFDDLSALLGIPFLSIVSTPSSRSR